MGIIARSVQEIYDTDGTWVVEKEFRVRARRREPRESPDAPHVLLDHPTKLRLDARCAQGPRARHTPDEERVGTLGAFVAHLAKNGILREGHDLRAPADVRVVQKCAHIAQALGIDLGYKFTLMENGAFSAELGADLYRLGIGRGGRDPLAGGGAAAEAFVRLVRGRKTEWLEAATFALHPESRWRTAEELAKRRGMIGYSKRTARDAYDCVARCLGEIGARA